MRRLAALHFRSALPRRLRYTVFACALVLVGNLPTVLKVRSRAGYRVMAHPGFLRYHAVTLRRITLQLGLDQRAPLFPASGGGDAR